MRTAAERVAELAADGKLFDLVDRNDDGTISKVEWALAFDKLDADKDGAISRKEWFMRNGDTTLFDAIKSQAKQKMTISRTEWLRTFDELDNSQDGLISLQEWQAFSTAAEPQRMTRISIIEQCRAVRVAAEQSALDLARGLVDLSAKGLSKLDPYQHVLLHSLVLHDAEEALSGEEPDSDILASAVNTVIDEILDCCWDNFDRQAFDTFASVTQNVALPWVLATYAEKVFEQYGFADEEAQSQCEIRKSIFELEHLVQVCACA